MFKKGVKVSGSLSLVFPCRLDTTDTSGVKTLVPIRPIACLTGTLDLGTTVVKLF